MYNLLKKSDESPKNEEKWDNVLNKEYDWKSINSSIFSTTKNTKLQWFQYRIVHRILGTNELLLKMNLRQNSNCSFCDEEPETTEHLFWTCRTITDLWEEINRWIFMETEIELPINLEFILFGFLEKNNKNQIRNLIILLTKLYIYRCKLNENQVNIIALKHYLKENLNLEKKMYQKNKSPEIYLNYWNPWLALLE